MMTDNTLPVGDAFQQYQKKENLLNSSQPDNVDIVQTPVHVGKGQWTNFLVSFLVDARGGAMRGCRRSGLNVVVPPRAAPAPLRLTCRYLRSRTISPPLSEAQGLASRLIELSPAGTRFLGPIIIEVPHFVSLRGKERELVVMRSDNGLTWKEHCLEESQNAVQDILNHSFQGDDSEENLRITRIVTTELPQYLAVVSRLRQEVHPIGPEGGVVSSTAVPQVQAIFPANALTKKIRVGLQAQPINNDLVSRLLGNRVGISPIVTVEPRRRKFHKPITLTLPVPTAANKGMINQYSGEAPTLRLLCSITGGNAKAQWEDVTGSTPLTFVKDCVSFTTTVSARFWLMDCRNVSNATNMASQLYNEACHVPFMAKFVVYAKRISPLEARLRVFVMTDDREDKTLEQQEHFTEVAKSRDVEVLEGKPVYLEFAGNLIPITKSGEQLSVVFTAFKENRLPFTVRLRDPDDKPVARLLFMSQPKVARGEPLQTAVCTLNIALPDNIIKDGTPYGSDLYLSERSYSLPRNIQPDNIKDGTPYGSDLYLSERSYSLPRNIQPGNKLEKALRDIGRVDVIERCVKDMEVVTDDVEKAVANVTLDQSGIDSISGDALKDSSFNDTFHQHQESGYLEDLNNSSILSINTSSVCDKYAGEEKKITGDFLIHEMQYSDSDTNTANTNGWGNSQKSNEHINNGVGNNDEWNQQDKSIWRSPSLDEVHEVIGGDSSGSDDRRGARGSSSGSDVALHEGNDLSDSDHGSDFIQEALPKIGSQVDMHRMLTSP